jgi:excisionase family DNA binding protein
MSLPCTDHLDEGLIRVTEAARKLGLSRSMVYQLMDRGELPYAKFGTSRRIPLRWLLDYARRQVIVPGQGMPDGQN